MKDLSKIYDKTAFIFGVNFCILQIRQL